MPSRIYTQSYTTGSGKTVVQKQVQQVWYVSPRVRGKLVLRANPSTRQNYRLVSYQTFGPGPAADSIVSGAYIVRSAALNRAFAPLEAESYARLRGRLYKGSASLGVTIASWKQSREMITTRYRQMTGQLERFEAQALAIIRQRNGRGKSIALDNLANQYLEAVFGWQPLLSDIHAACRTVVDTRPQKSWVSGSAQGLLDDTWYQGIQSATSRNETRTHGIVRHKRTVMVEVSNPNTWLRERAGLNNPAAVAWDLVPWSFVVNMFVNTGQLVNSISDFAGLTFTNGSTTRAEDLSQDQTAFATNLKVSWGGSSSFSANFKQVDLGAIQRPPLIIKLPGLNWGLAAIAASLFVQKFRRVESLVNINLK